MKPMLRAISIFVLVVMICMISGSLWADKTKRTKDSVAVPPPAPSPQIEPIPIHLKPATVKDDLPKADLQVGVVNVTPHNPGEGDEVTFEGNVMNYGVGSAPHPVVVMNVSGPAGTSFPAYQKVFNVTLTHNQGITFVQKFIVPKSGTYTCTFRLDPANLIAETNNNNNEKGKTFWVFPRCVDLIVCIDNGKRPPVGGSRDINAVVKNIGTCCSNHSGQVRLRFYVEGKGTNYYDIPAISPGQDHTITRHHSWGTSGTKTITAKVLYNWTDESNTQNNAVSGSYFVRLPHHDKYSTAPKVKCSTNVNFNDWQQCNAQY